MNSLTRYDPLGEVVSLRSAMDRLFEDSFISPLSWRHTRTPLTTPEIDVAETDDEVVVTAALPGIAPDDVEITLTGQTLMIRGEFKVDEKVDRDRYLYQERRYGSFARQLHLPLRLQGDKAAASFDNGLLTLRIPKAEDVKPRQIQIQANGTDVSSKEQNG